MLNNIENNRIERGRTSWSSYAWMIAESQESGIAELYEDLKTHEVAQRFYGS
jgi:hypothetical protein